MLARASIVAALAAAALSAAAPASASPQFLAYEGRNAVRVGDGGEKKTVGGIDIWMNGAPPHRFQVIGSLTDHAGGLFGGLRLSGLDREIADAARKVGGDAVILTGRGEAHNSRFVVVKYLTDDAAPDGEAYPGPAPDGRPVSAGPDTENLPIGAVARY